MQMRIRREAKEKKREKKRGRRKREERNEKQGYDEKYNISLSVYICLFLLHHIAYKQPMSYRLVVIVVYATSRHLT